MRNTISNKEATDRIRMISEHTVTLLSHLGPEMKILRSNDTGGCCNSVILSHISPLSIHEKYSELCRYVYGGTVPRRDESVAAAYLADSMLNVTISLDAIKDWYPKLTIGMENCRKRWEETILLADEQRRHTVAVLFQSIADSMDWLSETVAKLLVDRLEKEE